MKPVRKNLSSEEILRCQRVVNAAIPPENWGEILGHRHSERAGRLLERLHPDSTFTLPNSGESHASTAAFIHALDELMRHHYRQDPDDVFTYNFTSVLHPDLVQAGFTDQADFKLKLKHSELLKTIRSDVIEADMGITLRRIEAKLESPELNHFVRLAPVTDAECQHLRSNVEATRNSLSLYHNDGYIPFSEVVANLNDLLYATTHSGRFGAPVNLPDGVRSLNYRVEQGRLRAEDEPLARGALDVARTLESDVTSALDAVRQLKELGVGRFHAQGHIH